MPLPKDKNKIAEYRLKLSNAHKGRNVSEITRAKLRIANKGQVSWCKGKKGLWKSPHLTALNKKRRGQATWNKGLQLSADHKKKLSEAKKGKRGDQCNNWQGGKTPEAIRIRHSAEYRQWRMKVFLRDNFTCQFCNARNHIGLGKGIILEAHHIKSFAKFPELRFVVENGVTLCKDCHDLTKTKVVK